MEILYIILAFILGAVLAYFILKSSSVSRRSYEELQQNFSQKEADLNRIIAEISAQNKAQIQKIAEQQELNERQNSEIKDLIPKSANIRWQTTNSKSESQSPTSK